MARVGVLALIAPAVMAAAFTVGASAATTPPVNDDIANAISVTSGTVVNANDVGGTAETGDNEGDQFDNYGPKGNSDPVYACYGGDSVWYKVPAGYTHIVLTPGSVSPSTFDPAITFWSAQTATPSYSDLQAITSLRPKGLNQSGLTISQDMDSSNYAYFISVQTCNNANGGPQPVPSNLEGTFSFTPTLTAAPANDNYANATAIGGASGSVTGSNVGATLENGESACDSSFSDANFASRKTVWYSWTAPATSTYIFNTEGSTFNTVLALAPRTSNAVSDFGCDYLNDNVSLSDTTSSIQFSAAAGSVWSIKVDGGGGVNGPDVTHSGTYDLNWQLAPDTTPPTVSFASPTPGQSFPAGTTNVVVTANAADDISGVKQVVFAIDSAGSQTVTAGQNGVYVASFNLTDGPGNYTIHLSAVDNAGNASNPITEVISVAAPVVTQPAPVVIPAPTPTPAPVVVVPVTTVPSGYSGATKSTVGAGSVGVKGGVSITGGVSKVKSGGITGLQIKKKGAKITILFVGSRIDLHFAATKISGKAIITIDGKSYTIDCFSAHAHDLLKALAHLKAGKHKVTITALGTHNPKATGSFVTLTLFRVYA